MAEYIERDALVRQISCNMAEYVGAPDDVQIHDEHCNYAINIIEDAPAADVAPVVHGRWIEYQIPHVICCSNCDWATDAAEKNFQYCPMCGARMDGDDDG